MLAGQAENFQVLGTPTDACAQIRFTGRYHGNTVIWNATVCALLHANPESAGRVQFLEIGPGDGPVVDIRIGLCLEHIDLPALRKTVIMVQNYRRLHQGRHEFSG